MANGKAWPMIMAWHRCGKAIVSKDSERINVFWESQLSQTKVKKTFLLHCLQSTSECKTEFSFFFVGRIDTNRK